MELVSAATQGVFSIAVAAFLIWHNAKRNERTDNKIDELDRYMREEFTELVERQGTIIDRCSDVLCRVESRLAEKP